MLKITSQYKNANQIYNDISPRNCQNGYYQKRLEIISVAEDVEGTFVYCWWECINKLVQPLWKTVWSFLKKFKIELLHDPGIPLLGYLSETKHYLEKDICTLHSSVGEESACNAGDPGSIPGLGRSPGEGLGYPLQYSWASLVAQLVKNLPAIRETWVWSLGWEDPQAKGKATHSSILAWRIPWTIQSMRLQRVRYDWATFTHSCPLQHYL